MFELLHKAFLFLIGGGVITLATDHYLSDPVYYNIISIVAYACWATIVDYNLEIYYEVKRQRQK